MTREGYAELPEFLSIPSSIPPVLLVDDHQPNLMIATTYLEQMGYEFEIAEDGMETTRHIRNAERDSGRKRLPIIALTAHYMVADREQCLLSGMDHYMTKPIDPAQLEKTLRQYTKDVPV